MNTTYAPPKLILEIACNHQGNIKRAKKLIDLAKQVGAYAVKFQKRNLSSFINTKQYNTPHPDPRNAFGKTYGKHRETLEFSKENHQTLATYCKKKKIIYSCSVWDIISAEEIISLNPTYIKVPSACNTNFKMLEILRDKYKGMIHISLGMTTEKEEQQIIDFFKKKQTGKKRLVLYSCVSTYPTSINDTCLLDITRLKKHSKYVADIGFSGHHQNNFIDIAAFTLGASFIERHFTSNKQLKGTDHKFSLTPKEATQLNKQLSLTFKSLQFKTNDILKKEIKTKEKLIFSNKK